MANTYYLIASSSITSNTATITFDNIPSTYSDLELKISGRTNDGSKNFNKLIIRLNNDGSTLYSRTDMRGSYPGSVQTITSSRTSSTDEIGIESVLNDDASTASTFGSIKIYIPNYTSSFNKTISSFGSSEDNGPDSVLNSSAGLYRSTSTITRIDISNQSYYYKSGSSFWLYGIKNS